MKTLGLTVGFFFLSNFPFALIGQLLPAPATEIALPAVAADRKRHQHRRRGEAGATIPSFKLDIERPALRTLGLIKRLFAVAGRDRCGNGLSQNLQGRRPIRGTSRSPFGSRAPTRRRRTRPPALRFLAPRMNSSMSASLYPDPTNSNPATSSSSPAPTAPSTHPATSACTSDPDSSLPHHKPGRSSTSRTCRHIGQGASPEYGE